MTKEVSIKEKGEQSPQNKPNYLLTSFYDFLCWLRGPILKLSSFIL